jgi:hypothetical protein
MTSLCLGLNVTLKKKSNMCVGIKMPLSSVNVTLFNFCMAYSSLYAVYFHCSFLS